MPSAARFRRRLRRRHRNSSTTWLFQALVSETSGRQRTGSRCAQRSRETSPDMRISPLQSTRRAQGPPGVQDPDGFQGRQSIRAGSRPAGSGEDSTLSPAPGRMRASIVNLAFQLGTASSGRSAEVACRQDLGGGCLEPAAGMNTARPALARTRGHSPSKIVLFASRARTRPLRTLARAPSWPARGACADGCAGHAQPQTKASGAQEARVFRRFSRWRR